MLSIFNFMDYKAYVLAWVESRPKKGHGQWLRISQFLNVHTSLTSQIFKSNKDLNLEQAATLCDYLGFNQVESDYFLLLVQRSRAGNQNLRVILDRQIAQLQEKSKKLTERLRKDHELSDTEKSQFYSNWSYSAIRLSCGINGIDQVDDLVELLKLEPKVINKIVHFLLECGLLKKRIDGGLDMGPSYTHLSADSPWASVHHTNWRKKGFERYDHLSEQELIYTSPVSLSIKDTSVIRELHTKHIQEVMKIIRDSEPETLYCIGLDWFRAY